MANRLIYSFAPMNGAWKRFPNTAAGTNESTAMFFDNCQLARAKLDVNAINLGVVCLLCQTRTIGTLEIWVELTPTKRE